MKKREVDISPEQADKILSQAKLSNQRDYLILSYIFKAGLRRSEVVGEDDPRDGAWDPAKFLEVTNSKKRVYRERILREVKAMGDAFEYHEGFQQPWTYRLLNDRIVKLNHPDNMITGLQIQDFRWDQGGVYLRGKKADREVFQPIPPVLLVETHQWIGKRSKGPLFDIHGDTLYKMLHKYARAAGLEDWQRVHPHRGRHSFITQVWDKTGDQIMTQEFARHKNFNTTRDYIAHRTPEQKVKAIKEIFSD